MCKQKIVWQNYVIVWPVVNSWPWIQFLSFFLMCPSLKLKPNWTLCTLFLSVSQIPKAHTHYMHARTHSHVYQPTQYAQDLKRMILHEHEFDEVVHSHISPTLSIIDNQRQFMWRQCRVVSIYQLYGQPSTCKKVIETRSWNYSWKGQPSSIAFHPSFKTTFRIWLIDCFKSS